MGVPEHHRTTQTETQEVRDALQHLHAGDPQVDQARERHLEALSAAQGGRWLESSTVAHEGAGGYGTQRHHVPQTASPEVKAALAGRQSPEFKRADERARVARNAAQGGRWMEHDGQREQPEVQAALAHLAEPEVQAELEKKREARALAQGGRWLD